MSTRRRQSIHNHHEALAHMPVGAVLEEVDAALHNGPAAVLAAPPGAGKTTCVPLSLLTSEGGPWPDVSDAALMETLEDWLAPVVHGAQRLSDIPSASLAGALRSRLSWQQQRRLDDLAPTRLTVPSGSCLPIDYGESIPVLAVRLQEMFGLTATPAIVGGRLPLMLHLLSPAGRPVQITDDMAGFWRRAYPQVRKELRGRYPKHAWSEDPVHAVPTARAKPRRGR